MPRRLIPEGDYSADLHLRVPTEQLIEWDDLHDELLSSSMLRDFEEVREAYARSAERHEVQHRIDYAEERFSIPERLAYRMGGIPTMGHEVHSHPMRASAELSAYLAQVADDPAPRLAVLTMSRAVLNQYSSHTSHGYAAAVALEALAEHLGLSTKAAVGRVATRKELAQLMLYILDRPMAEVQKAARIAYVELFGAELPQVKRGKFTTRDVWRH